MSSRPKFDPSYDFVVVRDIKVAGQALPAGKLFDKALVSERRLRQMYDNRDIKVQEGSTLEPRGPRKLAVGPTDLYRPGSVGHEPTPPPRPEPAPKKRSIARRRLTRAA